MPNQHFVPVMIDKGVFTLIFTLKCYVGFEVQITHSSTYSHLLFICVTLDARLRATGMLQGGLTRADVAIRFCVHRRTVQSLWTRYQSTGLVHDRPCSGRPRVTSYRQDVYIRVMHFRKRNQTAEASAGTMPGLRRISGRAVQTQTLYMAIHPCRLCVRPLLLPRHRRARLQWSQNHQRCSLIQWDAVPFTDESRFHLEDSDGQQRVYR